jgi:hypothetical protein
MTKRHSLEFFVESDTLEWNSYLKRCANATFLHDRNYLSYHRDRYDDQSILIYDRDKNLLGLFPAAVDPSCSLTVVSHPGITYGGLLHDQKVSGNEIVEMFESIVDFYRQAGYIRLIYKPVPAHFQTRPSSDDLYAMFRLNAHLQQVDLGSVVDFYSDSRPHNMRSRNFRKAEREGLRISLSRKRLSEYWSILVDNLGEKYNVRPTHSEDEISLLMDRFPDNLQLYTVIDGKDVVGGSLLYCDNHFIHTQYIASTDAGRQKRCLDYLFLLLRTQFNKPPIRYLSFGISSELNGAALNQGLFRFKQQFGAYSVTSLRYNITI